MLILSKQTVVLSYPVYRRVMQIIEENPKNESVGVCFGAIEDSRIIINHFTRMANLDNSAVSFSLDYEILYHEIQNYEKKGELLVGIFHTHPEGSKLYPSEKDRYFMKYWPSPYLWLIGGIEESNPKLLIYTLLNEKIIQLSFLIGEKSLIKADLT